MSDGSFRSQGPSGLRRRVTLQALLRGRAGMSSIGILSLAPWMAPGMNPEALAIPSKSRLRPIERAGADIAIDHTHRRGGKFRGVLPAQHGDLKGIGHPNLPSLVPASLHENDALGSRVTRNRGIVRRRALLRNQRRETVLESIGNILVARRTRRKRADLH
jgi:hypothetical protein